MDVVGSEKKRRRESAASVERSKHPDEVTPASHGSKKSKHRSRSADESTTAAAAADRPLLCSPLARPLAGRRLTKKLLKLVKKTAKSKHLRRGVKEVVKSVRKRERGVCVLAADVWPPDVISHLPVLCEEATISYCFVPSRQDLGAAGQTKRPTSVTMVVAAPDMDEEYRAALDECVKMIRELHEA
ncbi:hypothetical protein CDCA_CDCA16G4168 [Cyanidium caldarium]|uniref:H/ACA ribonucleoprotein complex subunit 2 n=1 Tax=Cyanidium caldarium TaxID=2771 RepID=A0AAV9J273_CYACA|nr:hypothetical protein CDCA_CDCA16G4168 [Cyanidium caldarium]